MKEGMKRAGSGEEGELKTEEMTNDNVGAS